MSYNSLNIKTWNDATIINDNLCRICFSLTDLLIPIFEGEGSEQELCKKVQKYLPIKILPSDTLPLKLCYPCAKTLIAWDSLYTICLKTDTILQSFLREETFTEVDKEKVDFNNKLLMPPKKRKLIDSKALKKNKLEPPLNVKKTKSNISVFRKIKKVENKSEKTENKMNSKEDKFSISFIKFENNEEDYDMPNNESNGKNDTCLNQCEFCKKSYKTKKCLKRHLRKFHKEKEVSKVQKCSLCSNVYKTKANLERHYLREHLTDQVKCPVCHSSFNSKKLEVHLKSVHGVKTEIDNEEKFKCKLCDKWFKNKYVRNSHMKEAHFSEPIKCKLCDFEGVRTVLQRHKRDVHAEKRFMCTLCPAAFKTLHTLKMHMTSHSDIRCYTCDICGMGFKRLNNVRDHMKCHEEKSNQCQICGNFFARKRYLAIHEKTIHNFYADGIIPEEKGFECGTCGAKLKWKKNLLAHMRIHTGEKPYVCKICNKDFVCHGSLRTHMAKHSICALNEGESQNHSGSVGAFIDNNINS